MSAVALPLCVSANSTTTPTIVYWEDFSEAQRTGTINQSGSHRVISAANGFFACSSAGSTYDFSNGTFKYTNKASGDYFDVRFQRGSVMEKDLRQDFVFSFKIKASAAFDAQFTWSSTMEESASESSFKISGGKFKAGNKAADTTKTVPVNEWVLIELAFHYNENVQPDLSILPKGAIDSYTVMLNGESLYTCQTTKKLQNIDFFRMFRYTTAGVDYEFDDIRVALGSQSLKSFDENGGQNTGNYTQNISWFDDGLDEGNYKYSFCFVGDTQKVTYNEPEKLANIYDWIVANKTGRKIEHVFGLGDITDKSTDAEWTTAKTQISKLNGVVPYSLVRGNHDGASKYNSTFGIDAYTKQFEGFYKTGQIENSWKRLTIGEDKYLLMTLDWGAKDDVLTWASGIIEQYPDHKVIITTHAYLSEDGDVLNEDDADTPVSGERDQSNNNGDELWDKFISKHENIFLVVSGHIAVDYVVMTQTVGEKGNTVTQILTNQQDHDERVGAAGVVTMLYFSEDGKEISVETYSTVHQKYFLKENQFKIDISSWVKEEPKTEEPAPDAEQSTDDTQAPASEDTAIAPNAEPQESKGCGSVVYASALALSTVVIGASTVLRKKRRRE